VGGYAWGYRGVGSRDAAFASGWARGGVVLGFQLFARADLLWPDAGDAAALQLRLVGGIAYALPWIARIAVSYEGPLAEGALATQAPPPEPHALLIQVEGRI